jgi:hypothetical protein
MNAKGFVWFACGSLNWKKEVCQLIGDSAPDGALLHHQNHANLDADPSELAVVPVLKNARHELFCHEIIKAKRDGRTQGTAYTAAGFNSSGKAAEVNAARMLANARNGTQERVIELLGRGAKRAEVTVESLLNRLERNIRLADKRGQHSAVNGSVALMAQLRGLLVNRTEVASAGGFEGLTSVEEIVNKARGEFGDKAAAMLCFLTCKDSREQLVILDQLREMVLDEIANPSTHALPTARIEYTIDS